MDLLTYISLCAFVAHVTCYRYHNETIPDRASQQLVEFRAEHKRPVGVVTKVSGEPLDIRDVTTLNRDLFMHRNHFRLTSHFVRERIPERVVHAKGVGAFGYFEVTHDVSKYVKSDVFNGIGKRTPVVARFSTALESLGGTDLNRETKAMSLKMYTNEGNFDLVNLHLPIYVYKDPIIFQRFMHAFKRNPRTDLFDQTARWDFMSLHPDPIHTMLWLASDFGRPDGYRKMDVFAEHVYVLYNKHGHLSFVKFNFRTETGLVNMTDTRALAIGTEDPDYFNKDLYNAIAEKNYPAWRVEMDVLTKEDLMKVDYDPFDMIRLWKRGTYRTVQVGRLVLNKKVDNSFKEVDQSAFSPDNLVPGVLGPIDPIFRAHKIFYPDSQNYRLGVNHDNIRVNEPLYEKVYNRDGRPPVIDNMRDVPNYFPNSFNGPMPYVDEARPSENMIVYHRNAVDLQPMAEFYHEIVDSDAHRQRIANVLATTMRTIPLDVEKKSMRILYLISKDLGTRVRKALKEIRSVDIAERRNRIAQCVADVNRINVNHFKHHYDIEY